MSVLDSRPLQRPLAALTLVRLRCNLCCVHPRIDHSFNSHGIDKKCPFTGDVSIRGRILTGRVISTKMTRTLVIRRDYLHYIPKYSAS